MNDQKYPLLESIRQDKVPSFVEDRLLNIKVENSFCPRYKIWFELKQQDPSVLDFMETVTMETVTSKTNSNYILINFS